MLKKRFTLAFFFLTSSILALAQKADLTFTVGGSFVSDANANVLVICPGPTCPVAPDKITTTHQVFLEGTAGLQLLNAHVASLYVEVPFAGLPSQKLTLASNPSTVLGHLSSTFITPALRLKVLPGAAIAPWVSFGGGWAHFSGSSSTNTNKGALQYGGGVDLKTGIPHLGLRGELRDFVSGVPNFPTNVLFNTTTQSGLHHHNVLVGGGVVFSF